MINILNKAVLICFFMIAVFSVSSQDRPLRSFDEIFPSLTREQRREVFTERGFRNTFSRNETPIITPAANSEINLYNAALQRRPTQLVEALVVIPYAGRQLTMLDAYNTIGQIQNIKNYTIYSPKAGRNIPLFEESHRIDINRRNNPLPDPPPATVLPSSETIYLCLKDTYFGNTFFRGEFSTSLYGVTCNLTNHLAIWFLVFPVMSADKFTTILYVEPIREGMLVYGMVGIDIPDFVAGRINLPSNINRRLNIFISWLRDGFRAIV